jgi:hypothetical protein
MARTEFIGAQNDCDIGLEPLEQQGASDGATRH